MSRPSSRETLFQRILRQGRRRTPEGLLDDPLTRGLLAVAMALALCIGLARLPLGIAPEQVGWNVRSSTEPISLHPFLPEEQKEKASSPDLMSSALKASAHIDTYQPPEADQPSTTDQTAASNGLSAKDSVQVSNNKQGNLEAPLEVFELAGRQPSIVGGLGSLYLQVDYPMEARQKGLEGLVVLSFVVDRDGYVHNIAVKQPIHPLLDSAAVQAVRSTRFAPGSHEGKSVSVRMRLPIRFQLVSPGGHE